MDFKTACRYQTFLDTTIGTLNYYLKNESFVTKATQNHLKSKNYKDGVDEIIEVIVKDKPFTCSVIDIVYLIKDLIEEKLALSSEMNYVKESNYISWEVNDEALSIDSAIDYNKQIHSFNSALKKLSELKSTEAKTRGTDYKFNENGDQVPYSYLIESTTVIDFDRNMIKNLYKKQADMADEISIAIDEAMLDDCVPFETKYSFNDTIEDIIEQFITSKGQIADN